jgi:hypothetical protein
MAGGAGLRLSDKSDAIIPRIASHYPRADVVEEAYGPELVREITRAHAAARRSRPAE